MPFTLHVAPVRTMASYLRQGRDSRSPSQGPADSHACNERHRISRAPRRPRLPAGERTERRHHWRSLGFCNEPFLRIGLRRKKPTTAGEQQCPCAGRREEQEPSPVHTASVQRLNEQTHPRPHGQGLQIVHLSAKDLALPRYENHGGGRTLRLNAGIPWRDRAGISPASLCIP